MKKNNISSKRRTQLLLLTLCIFLSFLLWRVLNKPFVPFDEISRSENSIVIKEDKINARPMFYLPEISAFDEIIRRPLFNKARRPFIEPELKKFAVKQEKMTLMTVEEQGKFSLRAVIIIPDRQFAILQMSRDKSLHRIALGDTIGRWELKSITSHSVQFKQGNETKNLELNKIEKATFSSGKKTKAPDNDT